MSSNNSPSEVLKGLPYKLFFNTCFTQNEMPKSNNKIMELEKYPPKFTTIEDEQPSLEKAQKLVGGLVELVTLTSGDQLLINEEGLLKNLPVNEHATYIASHQSYVMMHDGIRGNAVLLKGSARWT